VARLDGPEREIRLLVDHREALIAERTRAVNRLRWHLHELDPSLDPKPRSLDRAKTWGLLDERLVGEAGTVARLARHLIEQCRRLTTEINDLTCEIQRLAVRAAPSLLAVPGCAALTAAKIIGETAGIDRFHSKDAYARYNGTAPLPVWSSNRARHRLSRTGNRQLNAALHRIALAQATGTPTPEPSSTNAELTETVAWKHSAHSNDAYQMSSTAPSTTTTSSKPMLPRDCKYNGVTP
jgi:transposase